VIPIINLNIRQHTGRMLNDAPIVLRTYNLCPSTESVEKIYSQSFFSKFYIYSMQFFGFAESSCLSQMDLQRCL